MGQIKQKLLIDTNVLIQYLRGYPSAIKYLDALDENLYVSVINISEIFAGVQNIEDEKRLNIFITVFKSIHINENIAKQAGKFRSKYRKTHGTGLADALIAASAQSVKATLVTLNSKHFPMLENIIIPY